MEGQKHGVEMKDFVLESLASEGSDRTSKGSSGHHSYTPVPADEGDFQPLLLHWSLALLS